MLIKLIISDGICEPSDVSTSVMAEQILLEVVVIIFVSELILLHVVVGTVIGGFLWQDGGFKVEFLWGFLYLPVIFKKFLVSNIIFVEIIEWLRRER
jgi:hypothetical protein